LGVKFRLIEKLKIMKMSGSIILGIIFIIIGISFIAKVFFKVDFPVFKILLALFFIYLGFRILFGSFGAVKINHGSNNAVFSESTIRGEIQDGGEYNAIFGKVTVDLREIELKEGITKIHVNAVFGGAEILMDKNTPIKIKSDVVFGGINLPDGKSGGFGTSGYISPGAEDSTNVIHLEANAVFGGIDVRRY
jgi:predicted membrane protein